VRLILAGSDDFSLPSLEAVRAAGHEVLAVLTAPDRPGDRGRPAPRPLRDAARLLEIPVLQPPRLRDPHERERVGALGAELLVVAGYGQLVPLALLERLPRGGLGVHPSLLPRHRGAAPIPAAILAGDPTTGVSIMRMERGWDTGPVLGQAMVPLPATATAPALRHQLAQLGARLLVAVLERLKRGEAVATPQDVRMATYAPPLRPADGALDWERSAVAIDRALRALAPWPPVTVPLAGLRVRLLAGGPAPGATPPTPGQVLGWEGESMLVATGDGAFRVDRVQPPSRRPMTAAAFWRGRPTRPPTGSPR